MHSVACVHARILACVHARVAIQNNVQTIYILVGGTLLGWKQQETNFRPDQQEGRSVPQDRAARGLTD